MLDDADEISLVSALQLKRARLHGSWAIELVCAASNRFAELRNLGLINEQIKFKQRFFVPTKKDTGLPILSALLTRYPVIEPDGAEEEGDQSAPIIEAAQSVVIDLEEWVLPPEEAIAEKPLEMVEPATSTVTVLPVEDESLNEPFVWPAPIVFEGQPFLWDLADSHTKSSTRRKVRQRPVIEEQGLLFSLQ